MSDYPLYVARYDRKHPADLVICETCKEEWTRDPAEGDPYDTCATHQSAKDGTSCIGQVHFKWVEVDACDNCGKLGETGLGGCCSRACQLMVEYAEQLKARTAHMAEDA